MSKNKFDTRINDASNVYFTSDIHFSHDNIIHSCHRPYKNVEEMNEALINNWNSVVNDDSLVFILGDVSWGNNWRPFLERMRGRKILILGNHDWKNLPPQSQLDEFFDVVTQQMHLKIEGREVWLNHFPFLCFNGTYRKPEDMVYALHGHIHYGKNSLEGKDIPRMDFLFPSQYDVGVDMNNYTPISWREIDKKIKFQIENNVNMTYWINYGNT